MTQNTDTNAPAAPATRTRRIKSALLSAQVGIKWIRTVDTNEGTYTTVTLLNATDAESASQALAGLGWGTQSPVGPTQIGLAVARARG